MEKVRNLIGVVLAFALVAFAVPTYGKSFYAELVKFENGEWVPATLVPNGTNVEIVIRVVNTSPEPATINSLAICNLAGVEILNLVGPGRLVSLGSDPICAASGGGNAVVDFRGIRRGGAFTDFKFRANVNETTCNLTSSTWTIAASTGNAFSSLDKFTQDRPTTAFVGCDGELSCAPTPVPGVNTFIASDSAPDDTFSGFFAGWRAPNWKNASCTPVAYKAYNNINGAPGSSLTDAFGTTVPPNFAVINYTGSATNGVLLAHTITFAVEPSDPDGLPDKNRKTFYCKQNSDCLKVNGNRKEALGCTSPAIAITSIPVVAGIMEPGCIRGANWVIVPPDESLPTPPPSPQCPAALRGSAPNCVQWAVDFLEAKDPPWGRGEL